MTPSTALFAVVVGATTAVVGVESLSNDHW
jgi:hypothetical protein